MVKNKTSLSKTNTMQKVVHFFFICVILISCKKKIQPPSVSLTKGISYELAKYRKQQVKDVIYQLSFKIPKEKSNVIPSKLQLKLTVKHLKNDLYLDFNDKTSKLKLIRVNNKTVPIRHQKEHIIIDKNYLQKGKNTIEISFNAGELSLNRNDDFLYTLLVPDRASTLFPCFDQPDIKANYKLTITAPKNWKVLCGGIEEKQIKKIDYTEHQFKQTDKMSTYLFSFVAGNFSEKIKNIGRFKMKFLYRENNVDKIKESVDKIFEIHQKSIHFLENYTAWKFPFQKMDFVGIPAFQYGGMEHVGAVQYRESSLFLDKNATQIRKLNRAKLIAHETSHMWFGDLVTMRWFNDVWMKEVFANFMADKIIDPLFPKVNHQLRFMMMNYPSAYSEDRTKGTNAIRQQLKNLKNAGSLYGRIIYNKAPIMMRQLELLLGKEVFKKGIQEYIKTYANKNADWNELVAILDKQSKQDIKQWSNIWVNNSGRPVFSDEITYKNGKISSFIIHQKAEDKSDKVWPQFFSIALMYDNKTEIIDVDFTNNATLSLKKAIGLPKPNYILYNYNGFGYGVFPVKEKSIQQIKNIKDEVARGYAYINLYENVLNGSISVPEAYNVFLNGISKESNELILNYISGRIQNLYWMFLTQEQQQKVQLETENFVFNLLKKNKPSNFKKILFKLYQSIAYSTKGREHLYQIYTNQLIISQLHLNERDKTDLAMKLVIYKHPKADEIIENQQKSIKNKDKLKRFQWLLPSLSNDVSIRDAFMNSLSEEKNREKESWVLTALSNLNHPLRHKYSIKYLKTSLDLLQEIQLTGDIFFPKNWLVNSIGSYSSKKAYKIVQKFLKSHPNYNPVLKKKLLQVIDGLSRAQKIKR